MMTGGGQRNEKRKDGKNPHIPHAVAASGNEERDRSKSP